MNNIKIVNQSRVNNLRVVFNDIIYFVEVENDDFNNFEIRISREDKKEITDKEEEEINNYLEEEKYI